MIQNTVFNVHEPCDCVENCGTAHDFMRLTNEMVTTIINLEDELVRWRQVLIKHLPPNQAQGLEQDILNNLSRDFEGDPAYDIYVSQMKGGHDPQQDKERIQRLYRIARGNDETNIDYL